MNDFYAGVGKTQIHYTQEMFPNFAENYTGIHDLPSMQMLLLEKDGTRVALISADVVILNIRAQMLEGAAKFLRMRKEQIILHSTHVLSTPHFQNWDAPQVIQKAAAHHGLQISDADASAYYTRDRAMVQAHMDALREICAQALESLAPAIIRYGEAYAPVNVNRVVHTADGWWQGTNPAGPSSHTVPVIRIDAVEGAKTPAACAKSAGTEGINTESGTAESGTAESGTAESGTAESGSTEPEAAGVKNAGTKTPAAGKESAGDKTAGTGSTGAEAEGVKTGDAAAARTIAILFNCNMAPGCLEGSAASSGRLVSADIAGASEAFVEEMFPGAAAIYTTGYTGDQWQLLRAKLDYLDRAGRQCVLDYGDAGFMLKDYLGTRLGEQVVKAADEAKETDLSRGIRLKSRTYVYPGQRADVPGGMLMKPAKTCSYRRTKEEPLHVALLQLGDICAVLCGVEIGHETAAYIRSHSPYAHTFILEFSTGDGGYLPEKVFYDRVTYQSVKSHYAAGAAERFAQDVVHFLQELHG